MSSTKLSSALIALGLVSAALAFSPSKSAGQEKAPATKWADIDKWPDFTTGAWYSGQGRRDAEFGVRPGGPGGPGGRGGPPPGRGPGGAPPDEFTGPGVPPLKPELAPRIEAVRKFIAAGGASCEPMGVVMETGSKFFFGKDVIIMAGMSDWYNTWRRIYLNRAEHGNPEPTYMGDSIGHWEGGTLVIDTTAIRPEAMIVRWMALDSSATHMVERYRLTDPETLELVKTVENPEVLTKPWITTTVFHRDKGPEFPEAYCWIDREAK
jgi:hypothetical protein